MKWRKINIYLFTFPNTVDTVASNPMGAMAKNQKIQHQKFIKLEFSIIMLRMLQGNDDFEQTRPWLQWGQYSQYFTPPSEELSSEIIVQVNGLF